LVRSDKRFTAVTLMEGKVAVAALSSGAVGAQDGNDPIALVPGERLTFAADRPVAKLDRPEVEKLTAWQRGKVPIDNLSLADAIVEMNRYNVVQLQVEHPSANKLRVSGIFRVGDSMSFARAVAQSYGLRVEEQPRQIVLAGYPRTSP
jgi:transmembrane sensor